MDVFFRVDLPYVAELEDVIRAVAFRRMKQLDLDPAVHHVDGLAGPFGEHLDQLRIRREALPRNAVHLAAAPNIVAIAPNTSKI